jgi:outer membrane biosynthesis protein TonB
MAEPIEANYTPDGDDWTITIKGRGRTLKATAPGIIAARDRTDQLVEELAPDDEYRTVVHLLNGDAVEFTTAYLTARMTTKSEPPPSAEAEPEEPPRPEPAAEATPEPPQSKPARKAPSPRPPEPEEAPAADEVASPSAS